MGLYCWISEKPKRSAVKFPSVQVTVGPILSSEQCPEKPLETQRRYPGWLEVWRPCAGRLAGGNWKGSKWRFWQKHRDHDQALHELVEQKWPPIPYCIIGQHSSQQT